MRESNEKERALKRGESERHIGQMSFGFCFSPQRTIRAEVRDLQRKEESEKPGESQERYSITRTHTHTHTHRLKCLSRVVTSFGFAAALTLRLRSRLVRRSCVGVGLEPRLALGGPMMNVCVRVYVCVKNERSVRLTAFRSPFLRS